MDPQLSALLTRLVNTLQEPSPELKQLAAVAGQNGLFLKINRWTTVLQIFMKAINREENKRLMSDVEVKMWLDDVKELADDVEEILDEISKQASRLKMMAQTQTSMGKKSSLNGLIPACFTSSNTRAVAPFDESLISRIIDITSRLEKLDAKRDALRLYVLGTRELQSAPGSITKTIYGRDKDKEKILEMVLRDEVSDHANFRVIPIIGTAGVGKTTLARLVYDDKAVEDFKPRAWVSLYESSNVFRISKAILESVTCKSCNLKDLDEVLVQLKEATFGRKFLFVLDDVSTENYGLWETLKSSFMAGAPGSKIIVTTSRVNIEFPVNLNIQPYTLEVLSDKACWSVFEMHASDWECFYSLLIREKVIHMCKGLPLAACILGGVIRFKDYEEWECILNTKIWDLADDNEILPVLKLSYQHLPLWLQRCFVYCAILPDDYEFEEKELVLLWIAEGLIGGQLENEQMVCEQLEDRGSKIFQDLLERSLLEHSSSHASKYRMHDLVKTMARWIHGETNFGLEDASGVNEQPEGDEKNEFEFFYDVDNIRTFMPGLLCNDDSHHITDALLSDLLPKFKHLRALSLAKHSITKLPNSVKCLRYLRYVNLSGTMIRTLPDSICSLLILQILLLMDCSHLIELPSNLRKLINLWHLDIIGVNLLRQMPSRMKEMESLRTLLNFIVGKGVGSDLKDLENLKFLRFISSQQITMPINLRYIDHDLFIKI
ncbi:putative disease resistance RPP13-like protein 1 [Pistacia vera]|uniref:putative disease resistance RPP13-like protein 1 n=1 Tax=Pistacia vera TaxID=55513 RepID=UPI0012634B1D|nr:putative disease resistance RPP13-like protein 1 [Pistacia vera]